MMNRKNGYYWVKIRLVSYDLQMNKKVGEDWVIALFDNGTWFYRGFAYTENQFLEIDERKIERK